MKTLLMSVSFAALLAASAMGQTNTGSSTGSATDTATGMEANAEALAGGDATRDAPMVSNDAMAMSAQALVGQQVYVQRDDGDAASQVDPMTGIADAPEAWEDIGEVGDVLIDDRDEVSSIVIDVGGFLGMGERDVEIGMSDLRFIPDSDASGEFFVLYTGEPARLRETEEFDRDASQEAGFRTLGDWQEGRRGPDSQAGVLGNQETNPIVQDAGNQGPGAMQRPDRDTLAEADRSALTSDDLVGARVYGASDDWVGEIGELVIADDGAISHVVIDVGGWLGIGERPVALEMDQVDMRTTSDGGSGVVVYVDFTEDELEQMPEWEG